VWFGCVANQMVIFQIALALFMLYFKVGFVFCDLEVGVILGFGENHCYMVMDLLKVFFKGLIGDGKLLFINCLGIFSCCHRRLVLGLEFALFSKVFDPINDAGICREGRGVSIGDIQNHLILCFSTGLVCPCNGLIAEISNGGIKD